MSPPGPTRKPLRGAVEHLQLSRDLAEDLG